LIDYAYCNSVLESANFNYHTKTTAAYPTAHANPWYHGVVPTVIQAWRTSEPVSTGRVEDTSPHYSPWIRHWRPQ